MVEKPILFSGSMVRAILESSKTQTRRVVKGQPNAGTSEWQLMGFHDGVAAFRSSGERLELRCPLVVGSRLWVRETWRVAKRLDDAAPSNFSAWPVRYECDGAIRACGGFGNDPFGKVRPSIFMPRWASRIFLEVTAARIQRLHEISEGDAMAEGVDAIPEAPAALNRRTAFAGLWDSINAKRRFGWDVNPWVWVYTFKAVVR